MTNRSSALLPVVALAAFLVAGCGGDGDDTDAEEAETVERRVVRDSDRRGQ